MAIRSEIKVILILVLPLFLVVSADEMEELAAMLHKTCVEQTGVNEALIDKVNKEKVMEDDEKLKCYIKCVLEQMSCIDAAGNIDIEATVAVLPDEMRSEAEPIIRSCGSKQGANACDSAWLTHKCYLETKPDVYMLV